MKQTIWMLALGMMSAAHAGEFLYQPAVGVIAITPQAGYRRAQTTRNKSDGEDPSTGGGLYRSGLRGEFGINDQFALGAALTYTDFKIKSDGNYSFSGVEPLQLTLRGRTPYAFATVLYGTEVQIGFDSGRGNTRGGVNRTVGDGVDGYSNSLVLTPYVGATYRINSSRGGITLGYDIFRKPTDVKYETVIPVTVTFSRGNRSQLTAFFEYQLTDILLGIDVGWIKQWSFKFSRGSASTELPGYGFMRANLYANITLTPFDALIPSYTMYSNPFSNESENFDDQRVQLAYRHTF